MTKLRLSHSLLSAWMQGKTDQAIATYFHLQQPSNPALDRGREFHETMSKHIEQHKQFPDWFFSYPLKNPQSEVTVTVPYNDLFDLKTIIDATDYPDIFEFKTGVQSSLEWVTNGQLAFAFLCCQLANIPVERGYLIRYDHAVKKSDFVMMWNNENLIQEAKNRIDSIGPEIYEFFTAQGLL